MPTLIKKELVFQKQTMRYEVDHNKERYICVESKEFDPQGNNFDNDFTVWLHDGLNEREVTAEIDEEVYDELRDFISDQTAA